MHSPLLKGLHNFSYRCHSLERNTDTQQLEKGKSPSWKEYHIHRLPLGKALHTHTKGERIVAQPIILGSPCWLHRWETAYHIKKKIESTHNHWFQEGDSQLHFAKDHPSLHSHKWSHKKTTYKKKQSTQCLHIANPHVVGKKSPLYNCLKSVVKWRVVTRFASWTLLIRAVNYFPYHISLTLMIYYVLVWAHGSKGDTYMES